MVPKTLLTLCLLSLVLTPATFAQDRVLHFPADHSLGKLKLLNDPDEEKPWHWKSALKWSMGLESKPDLGEAQGDVHVPADARVGLIVSGTDLPDLSPLADLGAGQIQSLYIRAREVKPGDACLVPVSKMAGLQTLYVNNIGITPAGWDMLAKLTSLERLKVTDDLDEADATQAARMKSLHALSFVTRPVSPETLSTLARLPLLEELHIGWLQPTAYASLKELTTVRTLDFFGWSHGAEGVAQLAFMPNLQSLSFDDLSNEELAALPDMPKLKTLQIQGRGYEYTAAALANLTRFPGLEKLVINGHYKDEAIQALPVFTSLKSLVLGSASMNSLNPLSDAALRHICKFRSLESLAVWGGGGTFTNEALQHLAELPNLKALSIPNNSALTDAGMAQLGKCRHLEYLYIRASKITDAALAQLEGLSQLKELKFLCRHESQITDKAIAHLQEKIPGLVVTE